MRVVASLVVVVTLASLLVSDVAAVQTRRHRHRFPEMGRSLTVESVSPDSGPTNTKMTERQRITVKFTPTTLLSGQSPITNVHVYIGDNRCNQLEIVGPLTVSCLVPPSTVGGTRRVTAVATHMLEYPQKNNNPPHLGSFDIAKVADAPLMQPLREGGRSQQPLMPADDPMVTNKATGRVVEYNYEDRAPTAQKTVVHNQPAVERQLAQHQANQQAPTQHVQPPQQSGQQPPPAHTA